MGCGASVQPLADENQKKEMLRWAAKEMMILCGQDAIKNISNLQIKAPKSEVGKFREMAQSCTDFGKELGGKATGAAGQAADAANKAADAVSKAAGGAAGGLLGGAMKMAGNVAAKAGDVAGSAVSKPFELFADGIGKSCDHIDGEFAKIGQELAANKKGDIIEAVKQVIHDWSISHPEQLVRGDKPHGQDQHATIDKAACSKHLITGAKVSIQTAFEKVIKDEIAKSAAVTAWKKLIEKYNEANEKIGEMGEIGAQFKRDPVMLDIEAYIIEQVRIELGHAMNKTEEALRAIPNSDYRPKTFKLCFTAPGQKEYVAYGDMTLAHYNTFVYTR